MTLKRKAHSSPNICNTSPFQYLHQLGVLDLLPALLGTVTVPPAVVDELSVGRKNGVSLPDLSRLHWITVVDPVSAAAA
jgi:uncharacterized protein